MIWFSIYLMISGAQFWVSHNSLTLHAFSFFCPSVTLAFSVYACMLSFIQQIFIAYIYLVIIFYGYLFLIFCILLFLWALGTEENKLISPFLIHSFTQSIYSVLLFPFPLFLFLLFRYSLFYLWASKHFQFIIFNK